ncbi:MAG: hypothetical protein ACJAX5_000514 [Patiriisocius sp.]|jgi:uncharacterized protein YdbL (DUF1318 family)
MNMSKLIFCLALLLSAATVQASPLDDARNAGQIVEQASGYVQATAAAPGSVKALAVDVNERRAAAYGRIAKKNGLTAEQVATESYKKRIGG